MILKIVKYKLYNSKLIPGEILALSAFALLLHVMTSGNYGYFRDELYFISCGKRLAWGYVDQPPFVPFVAAISNFLSNGSLLLFRVPASMAHAVLILLTGYLAMLLGANRSSALMAGVAVLISPLFLVNGSLLTMNAFEPLFWTTISILIVLLIQRPSLIISITLGVITGLAIINKHSTVFFILPLVFSLAISKYRLLLKLKWILIAICISSVIVMPHLYWQIDNNFPMLELLKNGQANKNVEFDFLKFVSGQVLENHPLNFLISLIGLFAFFLDRPLKEYRFFGLVFILFFFLMVFLKAKPYYLAPIYPLLFVAGSISFNHLFENNMFGKISIFTLMLISGSILLPLTIPILPIDKLISYQKFLGIEPQRTEEKQYNLLPQHISDQFGWEEIVLAASTAFSNLPEQDKKNTAIFASNYGEASAIDLFRDKELLPAPISSHNNYFLWGHKNKLQWLAVGGKETFYRKYFESVRMIAKSAKNKYAMPYQSEISIYLVKYPKAPIPVIWQKIKNYN